MKNQLIRLIIFAWAMTTVVVGHSRTISPEMALKRATDAHGDFSPMSSVEAGEYRLSYTAADDAYYVFENPSRGCLIVSGDDRVTPVLAEIPTEKFDPDDLAPGAAWLLNVYRDRIASLPDDAAVSGIRAQLAQSNDVAALYSKWADITPLMTCSWSQRSPYNMLCPVIDGARCVTGCVATAMAQVIRTIGYADCRGYISQGSGSEMVEYDFDNTPIDFDNLLDVCSSSDSEESRLAVARLMLACGLSVGMGYSPSASGAQSSAVDYGLIRNFGYDKNHTRFLSRSNFTTAKWESIIYAELSLGRPVFYAASSAVSIGHAFVVDGYRREGLWHVNWGWGGQSNGYFSLALLTPSMVSYGDTSQGYNIDQKLVKAVPPGADPGVALSNMFGSISVVSPGRYSVYYSGQGVAHENVALGAVIVAGDSDDIVEWIPFWTNQSLGANVSVRDNYSYDFSNHRLSAGEYRIYPAIIADGDESPMMCAEAEGYQHYVALSVSQSGKYDIYNPENVKSESECRLFISEVLTPTLYSGYESELRFVIVNNSGADFLGTLVLELVAEGESSPAFRKVIYGNTISGGYNKLMSAIFYANDSEGKPLADGKYYIRIRNANGDDLLAAPWEEAVEVVDEYPPGMHYGGGLTDVVNSSMMPTYLVSGEEWPHTPYINNEREGTIRLDVVFFRPGSNMPVRRYNVYDREMGSLAGLQYIEPFAVDLPFGMYEVCYEANNIDVSDRRTVFVGDRVGDHYYIPVSSDNASFCKHPEHGYSGDVAVSSEITVSGTSYSVTGITEDAFRRCGELISVRIPSSVTNIGRNAFAFCPELNSIVFEGEEIPFNQRNHVMPGADAALAIYAPAAGYSGYSDVLGSYQPVYASIECIESKSVSLSSMTDVIEIAVTPVHPAINTEFVIEPLSINECGIEITSADFIDGILRLAVRGESCGLSLFSIRSVQPGVEPAVLEVKMENVASISEIECGSDNYSVNERFYDLMGRRAADGRGYRVVVNGNKAKIVKF